MKIYIVCPLHALINKIKIFEGRARCGGVLRDKNGNWLGGYLKNVRRSTTIIAELWGVLEGIKVAQEKGYSKVEVQVDSNQVLMQ